MNSFQHFLITRMNVDWHISKPKTRQERNSLEFLNHRFDVFEKTCYPSVKSQTNKNFTWLILFDSELPDIYKTRMEALQSEINIFPLYIDEKENLLSTLATAIIESVSDSPTHIITTNLDSDDIISKTFVATIQDEFRGQDFEFINFPFGYLYQIEQKKLFLREWLTAPCHTLIEQYEDLETALKYSHSQVLNHKNRQIIKKPMWLMTVHGKNVRTRFDTNSAWQPLHRIGDDFCAEIDFPKEDFMKGFKESYIQVFKVLFSQKKWDNPRVKFKKIVGILFPSLIYLMRKMKYRDG